MLTDQRVAVRAVETQAVERVGGGEKFVRARVGEPMRVDRAGGVTGSCERPAENVLTTRGLFFSWEMSW